MRVGRLLRRVLYYVRVGYGLTSLPMVFMGYASSIYYLAIERVDFLLEIFPSFGRFLSIAGLTLPIFCGSVGYVYTKRSRFYAETQEIQIEANPYSTYKFSPISIPANKLFHRMALEHGYEDIANELDVLLKNSEV